MSTELLKGKTALITGASRGLGKAIALALADAGARLILVSRDLTLLESTAAAAKALLVEASIYQTDVTSEAQIADLQKAVARKFGSIQILVNNAGMNIRKPATDFTLEEWRQVIDTN